MAPTIYDECLERQRVKQTTSRSHTRTNTRARERASGWAGVAGERARTTKHEREACVCAQQERRERQEEAEARKSSDELHQRLVARPSSLREE